MVPIPFDVNLWKYVVTVEYATNLAADPTLEGENTDRSSLFYNDAEQSV